MQVYTTNQLAELLGSSASTLRSYKQRHGSQFKEGESFVRDEQGSLLWTMPGAIVMAKLLNTEQSNAWLESRPQGLGAGLGEGEAELMGALQPLDEVADSLAWHLIQQQFHRRIALSVQRILHHPTPTQREHLDRLVMGLGLTTGWLTVMEEVQGVLDYSEQERRAIAVLESGSN